jgi:hypothetical protein
MRVKVCFLQYSNDEKPGDTGAGIRITFEAFSLSREMT